MAELENSGRDDREREIEKARALFEATLSRWYWIDQELLREFRRTSPPILDGLEFRQIERWHRSSHLSSSAIWVCGSGIDEVRVTCNHQRDGNKFCTLKCDKSGAGRALIDRLGERFLERGGRLTHDSEATRPSHEATVAEIEEHAHLRIGIAMSKKHASSDSLSRIDRSQFDELKSEALKLSVIHPGWSEDSEHKTVDRAALLTYDQVFDRAFATAEWARGTQRLSRSFSSSARDSKIETCLLDGADRVFEFTTARLWLDNAVRPVRLRLIRLALEKHSAWAWDIEQSLFGYRGLTQRMYELGLYCRGWRRTPHSIRCRNDLREKLRVMKKEWSR